MTMNDVVLDAFGRVQEEVYAVLEGLSDEELAYRPGENANSIAWLVWHLTRLQDDHIASAAGSKQVWTDAGWADKFALPLAPEATGYGMSSEEVAQVRASAELLSGYYDAVHAQTVAYIGSLRDKDYERVVDENWDPPVTLAVRLVSVIADDLQHVGQAAYVRGLLS